MTKFVSYNRSSHILTVRVGSTTHSYRVPTAVMTAAPRTGFAAFFRGHIAGGFYRLS